MADARGAPCTWVHPRLRVYFEWYIVASASSGVRSCYRSPSSRFLAAAHRAVKLTSTALPKAFTRDGTLIANFSQEGVVRARVHGPEELRELESKL